MIIDPSRITDAIHAEVSSMVKHSRLVRKSGGIALVDRTDLVVSGILGQGAFSEVHEVRVNHDADPNRRYAMKHLKAKLLRQGENFRLAAAELAVEAHMLASFDHPNVMQIRGWAANGVASYTDGRHDSFFLLLDRLDETLDQRICHWRNQPIPSHPHQNHNPHSSNLVSDLLKRFSISTVAENSAAAQENAIMQKQQKRIMESLHLEKVGICVEIASALAYLHSQGVIFRDLKPNNIGFLNGRVQLFDFGLSRELPRLNLEEPFEMSGKVGTLRYMAPEVASHQVYNVAADVYSWAMVCYEIFVLEKPFAGWTREMHGNLVCGRGARPETDQLPSSIRPMLEACWNQYAYRRPAMCVVEQKMKHLEEQYLLAVSDNSVSSKQHPHHYPAEQQVSVELPNNFHAGIRKALARNQSESYTAATTSMSTESLGEYMYPNQMATSTGGL